MSIGLTEADIETLATDWFRALGYECALGSEISSATYFRPSRRPSDSTTPFTPASFNSCWQPAK
jgi:hypothetical protein